MLEVFDKSFLCFPIIMCLLATRFTLYYMRQSKVACHLTRKTYNDHYLIKFIIMMLFVKHKI
jgi:hypothetical protein